MTEPQRGFVLALALTLAPRWFGFGHRLRFFSSLAVSHNLFCPLFFSGHQVESDAEFWGEWAKFQIQLCTGGWFGEREWDSPTQISRGA